MNDRLRALIIYFMLATVLIVVLGPYVYMVFASFYDRRSFWAWPPKLPSTLTADAYGWIFEFTNFEYYYLNSVMVSSSSMIVNLIISALAGYGLSRYKWRFNEPILRIILLTYMFPFFGLVIPIFRVFFITGLYDSLLSLFILYVVFNIPFNTVLLAGFFQTIPREIEEAAAIDGASHLGVFLRIALPIAAPGLVTAGIFHYLWCWSEYFFSAILISTDTLRTLPPALYSLMRSETVFHRELLAAATMVAIPAVIITALAQKFLIKGITAGAIKG